MPINWLKANIEGKKESKKKPNEVSDDRIIFYSFFEKPLCVLSSTSNSIFIPYAYIHINIYMYIHICAHLCV